MHLTLFHYTGVYPTEIVVAGGDVGEIRSRGSSGGGVSAIS